MDEIPSGDQVESNIVQHNFAFSAPIYGDLGKPRKKPSRIKLSVMMLLVALVGSVALISSYAQEPPASSVPVGYSLVWEDNFDGSSLDQTKWTPKTIVGPVPQIKYTPDAITVQNGVAELTTYTENSEHITGWITTENKYQPQFGYVEAKIDFDAADKLGMGFWLFHGDVNKHGDPWNNGVEIDIVEAGKQNWKNGQLTDVTNNALLSQNWGEYGNEWDNHPSISAGWVGEGLADGYHIYAAEWTPAFIKYFIDGKLMWQVANTNNTPIPQRDEFIALSHHPWGNEVNYGDKNVSQAKMKVDYIKVYQNAPKKPLRPVNVSKTGGSGNAELSWAVAPNAVSYKVKRSLISASPTYTDVATKLKALNYKDTTASSTSAYQYVVVATNNLGDSNYSEVIKVYPDQAYLKQATSSSVRQDPNNAFDGNTSTMWESVWAVDPQWLSVDLAKEISVNKVVLNWTEAYAKSYKIEVSKDANVWTSVYSTTAGDSGIDEISFAPTQARYVRMNGTQRAHVYVNGVSQFGYALKSFEVYSSAVASPPAQLAAYSKDKAVKLEWQPSPGATKYSVKRTKIQGGAYYVVSSSVTSTSFVDTSRVNGETYYYVVTATNSAGESSPSNEVRITPNQNLAIWKKAFTSSYINTDTRAYKAFDGTLETSNGYTSSWAPQFSDPQWIYADLQTVHPVKRVKLTWDSLWGYSKKFEIQVSSDAVNWTKVYGPGPATTTGVDDITLPSSVNARYVRLYSYERNDTRYGIGIKEFEIYSN